MFTKNRDLFYHREVSAWISLLYNTKMHYLPVHSKVQIDIVLPYKRRSVLHLVEALLYKPEGRGFDFRWCHWNILLT
jgi:hypothetical protein